MYSILFKLIKKMTFMNSLSLYTVKVNIIPQNECCGSSVFAKFSYFPPLVLICIWQWGFSANFTSMCPGSPQPVLPRSLCWVPSLSQLVNKLIPPITYRQGRAGQGRGQHHQDPVSTRSLTFFLFLLIAWELSAEHSIMLCFSQLCMCSGVGFVWQIHRWDSNFSHKKLSWCQHRIMTWSTSGRVY